MSQIDGNIVIVPTIISGVTGSLAFMPAGLTTSSYEVTGSDLETFIRETASFTIDAIDNQLTFKIPATASGQSQDITALFVTSSGINPRVGIGTTEPKSTLEFLETSDTTRGSELVLAGSRTTKGAIIGDSAGILNFAIPTGSANILDSGSVGKIKGIVTNETATGVEGKLTLELFKNVNQSEDVIEFGYNLGHVSGLFNAVFTSSIELKDFTSVGYSRLSMYDFSDSLTFEVLNGNITASGNISASGDIIAGNITSNGYGVVSQSGNFVNNEFIVAVGTNAVTSSDALAVDSDGNLGIGTPNPEVRLHMLGEAPQTTQILMEQFNNTADAPDIRTRRYRGTSASRADVQIGDYLFRLNVHGQDDGTSELYGSMRFDVDGTNQDALEWGLQTRDTTGTVADRITVDSSGGVNILGGLEVGPTLQFQTQSTPPTAVAGTLYIDSNYDLYIAQ